MTICTYNDKYWFDIGKVIDKRLHQRENLHQPAILLIDFMIEPQSKELQVATSFHFDEGLLDNFAVVMTINVNRLSSYVQINTYKFQIVP